MNECKRCGFPDGLAMHTCRPKKRVSDSSQGTGSVHYRLEGLEARSDFWRGLSTWDESTENPIEEKVYYEKANVASNLGWRGFRIVKRTIEAMEPND